MLEALENHRILIVEDSAIHRSEIMRVQLNRLESALKSRHMEVLRAYSCNDALPLVSNDMDLDCLLLASDLKSEKNCCSPAMELLDKLQHYQKKVPVFLLADREKSGDIFSPDMLRYSSELVWIFEDSPDFIAGRIASAVERYRSNLLPPLMKAIWQYNEQQHEYSWAAPGHQGGIGFTKSPAGKKFFDFYGENLFRTDTGIERTSIGSLLESLSPFL